MKRRINQQKNSLRTNINSNERKFFKLIHKQVIIKRKQLNWIKTDEQ
jgi:hypothetical protein